MCIGDVHGIEGGPQKCGHLAIISVKCTACQVDNVFCEEWREKDVKQFLTPR